MNHEILTLPADLCRFKRGGIEWHRQPSQEEWEQVGRFLAATRQCSLRWLADWRRRGRNLFGDETVVEFERQMDLQFKELKAMSVLEGLESEHLDEVAALSDEHALILNTAVRDLNERRYWAISAATNNLSPRELALSIRVGEITKIERKKSSGLNAPDKSVGLVTIEGIKVRFDMWLRKVEEYGFPDSWTDEQLETTAEYLAPMYGLVVRIRYLLSQRAMEKDGGVEVKDKRKAVKE